MSRDVVVEAVPNLSRRNGDSVLAGANNSTILLGRDRLGSVSTGYGSSMSAGGGKSAGAMHLIVGRKTEDTDIDADAATVYLSQRTDADVAAGTLSSGPSQTEVSAIVCRADCMRLVPRTDFKLVVGKAQIIVEKDGSVTIDGDISLGKNAASRLLKADEFAAFWGSLVIAAPNGPCAPLLPIPSNCFTVKTRSE